MSRSLGMAIAGALVCAVAGCTVDSFLTPSFVTYGPKVVAAGSVTTVCGKLQDGLSDAGIAVQMKRVPSGFRLSGITKSGKVFCLHLHEKREMGSVQTQVRVQWDLGGDDAFWQMVVKLVDTPKGGADVVSDADGVPRSSLAGRDGR
jgi:hypothetical protein